MILILLFAEAGVAAVITIANHTQTDDTGVADEYSNDYYSTNTDADKYSYNSDYYSTVNWSPTEYNDYSNYEDYSNTSTSTDHEAGVAAERTIAHWSQTGAMNDIEKSRQFIPSNEIQFILSNGIDRATCEIEKNSDIDSIVYPTGAASYAPEASATEPMGSATPPTPPQDLT